MLFCCRKKKDMENKAILKISKETLFEDNLQNRFNESQIFKSYFF